MSFDLEQTEPNIAAIVEEDIKEPLSRDVEVYYPYPTLALATRIGVKHEDENGDRSHLFELHTPQGKLTVSITSDGAQRKGFDSSGAMSSVAIVNAAHESLKRLAESLDLGKENPIPTIFKQAFQAGQSSPYNYGTLAIIIRDEQNRVAWGSIGSTLIADFDNMSQKLQVLSKPPIAFIETNGADPKKITTINNGSPQYERCFNALLHARTAEDFITNPTLEDMDTAVLESIWANRTLSILMNDAGYVRFLSHGIYQGEPGHLVCAFTDGVGGIENLTIPTMGQSLGQGVRRATQLPILAKTLIEQVEENKVRFTSDDQSIVLHRLPNLHSSNI